jgi:serine/threonine protein kinase
LGTGTFGKVYSGQLRGETAKVAVKVQRGERLHSTIDAAEIALTVRVQGHCNVIRLRDYWYSPYFVVMITEKHDWDLFHLLQTVCPKGGLQTKVAMHVTHELCAGAAHVHKCQVLHRDMHSANMLLSLARGQQPGAEIAIADIRAVCIADFGASCDTRGDKPNIPRRGGVGALITRGPEVFLASGKQVYDTPLDVWSIGVLLVEMQMGTAFFRAFKSRSEFTEFWERLLGPLDAKVARKNGWIHKQTGPLRPGTATAPSPIGLRPLAGGETENSNALTTAHCAILRWDPGSRRSAKHLCDFLKSLCDFLKSPMDAIT